MAKHADIVYAFLSKPIERSKGTANMIHISNKLGKAVYIYEPQWRLLPA